MFSEIQEYVAKIESALPDAHQKRRVLYRGQSNSDWGIESSLERFGQSKMACEQYYLQVDAYKSKCRSEI